MLIIGVQLVNVSHALNATESQYLYVFLEIKIPISKFNFPKVNVNKIL